MTVLSYGSDIVQGRDRIRRTSAGYTTIQTFTGLRANLLALREQFERQGYETDLVPRGAADELVVNLPGVSVLQPNSADDGLDEQWTLQRQEYRRQIASAPFMVSAFADGLERAKKIAEADHRIMDMEIEGWIDSQPEAIRKYVTYRLMGTDYYVVYTPVVTQTQYAVSAQDARANPPASEIPKIVDVGDINAPNSIIYNLPNNWQWMEVPPLVSSTAERRRYRVERQWIGAEKWADIYQGGTFNPLEGTAS